MGAGGVWDGSPPPPLLFTKYGYCMTVVYIVVEKIKPDHLQIRWPSLKNVNSHVGVYVRCWQIDFVDVSFTELTTPNETSLLVVPCIFSKIKVCTLNLCKKFCPLSIEDGLAYVKLYPTSEPRQNEMTVVVLEHNNIAAMKTGMPHLL